MLSLTDFIPDVQINAQRVAQLDVLHSFAELSKRYNYAMPHISEDYVLDIKNGRHPVIEQQLVIGEEYIANDIYIDRDIYIYRDTYIYTYISIYVYTYVRM